MAWKKRRTRLRSLAEGLLKAGALQFGTFTLSDGKDSSYYVNFRGVSSYPGLYRLIVDSMEGLISKAPRVDALCAVPGSGFAIAAPLALAMGKPMIYTRTGKQANDRVVEGEVRPNWKVAIVNDLLASGKTILSAAQAVEQEGAEVTYAAVVVDRLEGARERLSKKGIGLHAVTDILELSDTLFSMELITQANLKSIARAVGTPSRP